MDSIGRRIKAARTKAGLTQQALADALGISRVSVTQWEGDTTKPDGDNIQRLPEILGGSVDWFYSGRGDAPTGLSVLQEIRHDNFEPSFYTESEVRDAVRAVMSSPANHKYPADIIADLVIALMVIRKQENAGKRR